MNTLKVRDGQLHYESYGSGDPLILIHCGFYDSRNWKYQIQAFSKKFRVIAYDQRGAGQSSVPTQAFSPVEDLRELLDQLGIQQARIVGHSIGGQIAINFAAIYPERVKKLALLAPALDGYEWSEEYQSWSADLLSDLRPEVMTRKVVGSGMCAIVMKDPELAKIVPQPVLDNTAKLLTWKSSEIQWGNPPGTQILNRITAPTLVMTGDQDLPDIRQIAETLKQGIPNVQSRIFSGADHMINFGRPDEFNEAVIQFMS